MKKFFAILLALLIVLLVGCSKESTGTAETETSETIEATSSTEQSEKSEQTEQSESPLVISDHYEQLYVDIGVGEDGFYGLMAPVDFTFEDGELTQIYIDNPALLYFCVSSRYDNGVYILKLTDGDQIIETLCSVRDALVESGKSDLANRITEVLDILNESGPIISAST